MPGFTTHYLFGQQTYQCIQSQDLKQTIQKYHTVYSLGLQGPDIFFYDVLSALLAKKNPGSTAHTADTRVFLRHLLESPKIFPCEEEREIACVYILGFVGHYLLDSVCHPYVYALSHYNRQTKGYIGKHICLETDIDTLLLRHYQQRPPSEFHQSESINLSKKQRLIVSTLLYFAFSKSYPGLGITRRRILHAIHAMRAGTKLLYDPTGRKKLLVRRIESVVSKHPILSPLIASDTLIFHKDPCNLRHRPWKNPWDEQRVSRESFYDLFERAQLQYCHILYDMDNFFSMERDPQKTSAAIARLLLELGNCCYHSGLNSAPYIP